MKRKWVILFLILLVLVAYLMLRSYFNSYNWIYRDTKKEFYNTYYGYAIESIDIKKSNISANFDVVLKEGTLTNEEVYNLGCEFMELLGMDNKFYDIKIRIQPIIPVQTDKMIYNVYGFDRIWFSENGEKEKTWIIRSDIFDRMQEYEDQ